MSGWLATALERCSVTPEVEDYFLGRGGKEETLRAEGITTWTASDVPLPDQKFQFRYGRYGERLDGMLICPVHSPKGALIGFEGRSIHRKYITDYRLPEEKWNPFFLGTRSAMPAIWAGGDVWLVEGLFDKCPLEWAVPPQDAVLATVRASLSRKHLEFLRRFCKGRVHLVYDRDETGRKATVGWVDETGKRRMGALDLLRRAGLNCSDVFYTGGKDPGEIWDKGGAVAVRAAFNRRS